MTTTRSIVLSALAAAAASPRRNVNGPLMLESVLQLSWEKQVRSERITRVSAGA